MGIPLNEGARELYRRQLRRLAAATRVFNNPLVLAQRINNRLAKEGFVQNIVRSRFLTQGVSGGAAWRSLAPSTVKQRARQGFPPLPILYRSGMLADAATTGRVTATSQQIILMFKDGPAPVYIGKGRSKLARVNRRNVAANNFFGAKIGRTGRLSDYAEALNANRPFYQRPTQLELMPLFIARDRLIAATMETIANGGSLNTFL